MLEFRVPTQLFVIKRNKNILVYLSTNFKNFDIIFRLKEKKKKKRKKALSRVENLLPLQHEQLTKPKRMVRKGH